MKKSLLWILLLGLLGWTASCGYTTRSLLPSRIKTVHVAPFKNKIISADESTPGTYIPLLEVKIRNAVVDRFLFDGNLRVADSDKADLILKGELLSYRREGLRYTEDRDVQEYRIAIDVSLKMWDQKRNEPFWEEPSFTGDTTYFVSGPSAKSETVALEEALKDLARRIVERTIENW